MLLFSLRTGTPVETCRFDEHAQTDLPTMIDYVLKLTNQSDLFYVGHSQGTIMGFAGFTFNQSLASHIKAFFALAPVTTVKNIQGAFRILADHDTILVVSCVGHVVMMM